jgi:flagellar protein FlaJ
MATVSLPRAGAPASTRSLKAVASLGRAKETKKLNPEQVALFGGVAVGMLLFVFAFLNGINAINTPVRPDEPSGANPAVDFFVLGLLAICGPYGFLASARIRRVAKIEERLPDFLRDVAEAGRFGMTLPDAIVVASKGRYGLLTEEIKKMASQLEWGVPVTTALELFEERVRTPLVSRVVSIITRANDAGGNVADVLTMVAHDIREVQLSYTARRISMLTYVTVIYIAFFVFLVTIYIMAAVFLPQMILAGKGIATSSLAGSGAVTLSFEYVPLLFLAFMAAVIVHAVGDGIMAGVLYNGRMAEGLQHATVMLVSGWAMMRFVVPNLTI